MAEGLLEGTDVKQYIFAGNAIFTAVSRDDVRYTYKFVHYKDDLYYIHLLSNKDNTNDYSYIGFYFDESGVFKPRNTLKDKPTMCWPRSIRLINWLLSNIDKTELIAKYLKIYHSGRCAKCGRLLTTPESIKIGIGPECRRNLNG